MHITDTTLSFKKKNSFSFCKSIMFPTSSMKLRNHMGLLFPACWKRIRKVADVPVGSPEMTFWDKTEQDRKIKLVFSFSINSGSQAGWSHRDGALSKAGSDGSEQLSTFNSFCGY